MTIVRKKINTIKYMNNCEFQVLSVSNSKALKQPNLNTCADSLNTKDYVLCTELNNQTPNFSQCFTPF